MSQNEQIVASTNCSTMKLDKLNLTTIKADEKVAIVRGNVSFQDMESEANKFGLTTKVRQASGIFGILSSIVTNVHGRDFKAGCIGNTVNWIRALDSESNEVEIRRGSEEFKACVGSFGATYLLFEVEIQLTENIILKKEVSSFGLLGGSIDRLQSQISRS